LLSQLSRQPGKKHRTVGAKLIEWIASMAGIARRNDACAGP
jgi:hypothetical protein